MAPLPASAMLFQRALTTTITNSTTTPAGRSLLSTYWAPGTVLGAWHTLCPFLTPPLRCPDLNFTEEGLEPQVAGTRVLVNAAVKRHPLHGLPPRLWPVPVAAAWTKVIRAWHPLGASLLAGLKAPPVPLPLRSGHLVWRGDNSSSPSLRGSALPLLYLPRSRSERIPAFFPPAFISRLPVTLPSPPRDVSG